MKIYEKLAENITGVIEAGDLKGGDRLPPERKLAETYQVSRNTVREAIRILTEKRILVSRTGSGTYVAESPGDIINDALGQRKNRLKDIFELRKILEPQIAALAAERISPRALTQLEDVLVQQETAFLLGQSNRSWDELFHHTLAEASGNKVLLNVYERLQCIFSESRENDLQNPARHEHSLKLHKDIFNAVKAGDATLAERKMKQHMQHIQKSLDGLRRPEPEAPPIKHRPVTEDE